MTVQLEAIMSQFEKWFTTRSDLIVDVRSGQTTLGNRVNVMDGERESGGVRRAASAKATRREPSQDKTARLIDQPPDAYLEDNDATKMVS